MTTRSGAREITWLGREMDVQYEHSQEGLRQNFIVHQRPVGAGDLQVVLHLDGDLRPELRSQDELVLFHADGSERSRLSGPEGVGCGRQAFGRAHGP
jgi:hypothetical protein